MLEDEYDNEDFQNSKLHNVMLQFLFENFFENKQILGARLVILFGTCFLFSKTRKIRKTEKTCLVSS